jgi:hypothetical protein
MTMKKEYYSFSFELEIDGYPCPPEKVCPLFQSDPFPGGHQYTCVISGKRLRKYFDFVPFGKNESVSQDDAREFFIAIGLAWIQNDEEEKAHYEFFLNSVKEIDFDGERLKFSGICSPVVRGG